MRQLASVCYLFISCLFFFNVSAQKDSAKYYLRPSINGTVGLGLSIANLNSANNTEWMDFVKPGFNNSVSGELPLYNSHFGARASFSYYRNSFDMPRFIKQLDSATPYTTATSISYGAFTQYTLMIGANYVCKCRKLICECWLECGAEYLSLPNTEVNIIISKPAQSNLNRTVIYTTNLAFAAGFGGISSYRLYKNWWLTISAEGLYANVSYNDVRYDVYIQHIQYTTPETGTARMIMLSINAGLKYLL